MPLSRPAGRRLVGPPIRRGPYGLPGVPFIYVKVGTAPKETYVLYKLNGGTEPRCTAAGTTGASDEMIQTLTKQGSALLCLTSPKVFEKKPMFTQDQWDKIAKGTPNLASLVVPTVLPFAIVLANVPFL
ncbi:hypothetical protein ACSSS7_000496 [Eimeria intestinalis]